MAASACTGETGGAKQGLGSLLRDLEPPGVELLGINVDLKQGGVMNRRSAGITE